MDEEDENQGLSGAAQGEDEIQVSSPDGERAGDLPEDQPAITSRLSVKRVVEVVRKFDEYKRWLVTEIGFGGILKLPMLAKLDLRMSVWVMRKVIARSRVIDIDEDQKIGFTAEDFHKIFGIPCGNRDVLGRDAQIANSAINFIKQTIGMDNSVAQNLKVAERFINREISEDSSKIEKDCFQIAFVIFVMGYLIAPCTKHDTMTIDFWGALANPELIAQFNWCEYAIEKLMAAVVKVQSDYQSKAATVHLCACHLFLQIFLLDNIELGLFNMPHSVLPRVQRFDQKTLRQMITMAYCMKRGKLTYVPSGVRPPDVVCYTRVDVRSQACIGGDASAASEKETIPMVPERVDQRTPQLFGHATIPPPNSLGEERSAYQSLGPRDFANHLRRTCHGDPVLEELSLMLKQQNAKCTLSMSLLRSRMQSDMICFADRVVSLVRDRCRCCQNRGLSKCVTIDGSHKDLADVDVQATRQRPISMVARRLEMSDDEGGSSMERLNQNAGKRIRVAQCDVRDSNVGSSQHPDAPPVYDNPVVEDRVMEEKNITLDRITVYAQVIMDMVRSLYDTAEVEQNVVYFGNMESTLPRRKYAMSASFARNPWVSGCVPQPPPIPLVNKFFTWIFGGNDFDLDSVWFVHKLPRLVRVNAVCVQQQIAGTYPLDHEVAVLALRRFNQLDVGAHAVSKYMLWREVLEPDFSTYVLAGEKVVHVKAVQLQLSNAHHDITACQTFFVPAILDHGWAVYMWDMLKKEIHILDPLCAQVVGAEQRHTTHQEAVSQIHTALFSCLNEFFAKWHCAPDRWKRKFPKITCDVFTRDESGICALHVIRQYDGDKMMWPLTQKNLATFRRTALFEVFRLRDEHGNFIADDVLQAALEEGEG